MIQKIHIYFILTALFILGFSRASAYVKIEGRNDIPFLRISISRGFNPFPVLVVYEEGAVV